MRKPAKSKSTKRSKVSPRDVLRKALAEGGVWSFDAAFPSNLLESLTRRGWLAWRMREHNDKVFAYYTLTIAGRSEAEGLPIPGSAPEVEEIDLNEDDDSDAAED